MSYSEAPPNSLGPRPSDALAGIEVTADFQRFRQIDDVFSRAFYDSAVRTAQTDAFFASYRIEGVPRRGEGFTQKDFALRNAAWAISDMVSNRSSPDGRREGFQALMASGTPIAPTRFEVTDPAVMTAEIKTIAKLFGADLVGVTDYDERWTYESRVDTRDFSEAPVDLPKGISSVIVLGHGMDHDLVQAYPSALGSAAAGLEYSHEASILIQLVAYIRGLGYEAVGSMNDTALVIPYAIKAGLGEYARNQLVITAEFGPRLRFSKVFTNLPLAHDAPRQLGVANFCAICTKCADACPVKALPFGPPSAEIVNRSSIKGVRKWTSDAEKCFGYWAKLTSDCAICMRVCPFNRDYSRASSRAWLKLALSSWRRIALWWDEQSKRATRLRPRDWWSAAARRQPVRK